MTAAPTHTSSVNSHVTLLREHGWTALRSAIPRDDAKKLRISLYGTSIACGVIAQGYTSNITVIPFYTRVSVVKDVPDFARFLAVEPIADVIRSALGGAVCVTSTTLQIHEPDAVRGAWHRGEPFDSCSESLPAKDQQHFTAVLMFSPFTADNGGLCIAPGSQSVASHTLDGTTSTSKDELTLTGGVGDVMIFDSGLRRAVAANDGDVPRVALHVGFALSSLGVKSRPRDAASILMPAAFGRIASTARPQFEHWVAG